MTSLTPREAAVIKEMADNPGQPISIWELADACGWPDAAWDGSNKGHHLPRACDYTYNVLQSIKAKFGRDVLVNVPQRGYMLRDGALR